MTPVPECPCPQRFYHLTASSPRQPGLITWRHGGAANPFHHGETEAQMKQATCSNEYRALAPGVWVLVRHPAGADKMICIKKTFSGGEEKA